MLEDTGGSSSDSKRIKLELDPEIQNAIAASLTPEALKQVDWKQLDANTVTEVIVANLEKFSEMDIERAIAVSHWLLL